MEEPQDCVLLQVSMWGESECEETEAHSAAVLAKGIGWPLVTTQQNGSLGKAAHSKGKFLSAGPLHACDEILQGETWPGPALPISPKVKSRARARTRFGKSCWRGCQGKAGLGQHPVCVTTTTGQVGGRGTQRNTDRQVSLWALTWVMMDGICPSSRRYCSTVTSPADRYNVSLCQPYTSASSTYAQHPPSSTTGPYSQGIPSLGPSSATRSQSL